MRRDRDVFSCCRDMWRELTEACEQRVMIVTFFSCCRDMWRELTEACEQRALKLQGAGEIHRFNRDVEDALSRIQEKYTSIPDDLGRDLKQTQAYQKSHEAFENELVALEAQVR